MKMISKVLIAALVWIPSLLSVVEASPFIMPTASRSATMAHLAFTGRGGAASRKTTSFPTSELFESITSGFGGKFDEALETGVPTQLTYGFIAGFCSGIALKKAGQLAATVLGIGFVSLQTLSYFGYIEIRHDKFKSNVENSLDLNKDGKVDKSDFQQYFDKLMGVLTYNMPGGAGFVGGFLGGVRM